MPSLGGLVSPTSIVNGVRQSLLGARGANPRAAIAPGSFDRQLEQALRGGADAEAAPYGIGVGVGAIPGELDAAAGPAHDSLRARYEVASAAFEQHFRRLLQQHNIDLDDGVVLATTADGEVQIIGEHPHKQAIEQLFRDDTELRARFSQLDALATLQRAAERAEKPADFQFGPGATTEIGRSLDSAMPGKFSLAVHRDRMVAQFS